MGDAQAFNLELDRLLEQEGKVDRDTYALFIGAYHYDAASTVSWLISKLRILQMRLQREETIYLWDASNGRLINCTTARELDEWVNVHFSSIDL